MGVDMTGRVTGRTVVNGVPAVNVRLDGDEQAAVDVKVLNQNNLFDIGDEVIVKLRGRKVGE